jgi:hypothetical protein
LFLITCEVETGSVRDVRVASHRIVQATLIKPVVGLGAADHKTGTLPRGASIEVSPRVLSQHRMSVLWNGFWFWVHREDLLDACSVEDVRRIGFGDDA